MKTSENRILTTHVGSLPRSKTVTELVFAHEAGETLDKTEFDEAISSAVSETVRRQCASAGDVVSDGEMSKISYATNRWAVTMRMLALEFPLNSQILLAMSVVLAISSSRMES